MLRTHGIQQDPEKRIHNHGCWYYEMQELGYNYRLTDFQAALGLSQIDRLDEFVAQRHVIANRYDQELKELPLRTPLQSVDTYSAFHLYIIRILPNEANIDQGQVHRAMIDQSVFVNLHYIPVYLHPYYERFGFKQGYCPEAEKYYQDAISIPMYPALSDHEQTRVIRLLNEIIK